MPPSQMLQMQPSTSWQPRLEHTSGQLAAIQTKAFAKFYALLTAEQRTKLDELHANGRGMKGLGAELSGRPWPSVTSILTGPNL